MTQKLCKRRHRPVLWLVPEWDTDRELTDKFIAWLNRVRPRVLNVAGNRESVCPGIGERTETILKMAWPTFP